MSDNLHSADNRDFLLESYDYPLPEEYIAQSPAQQRDASRLMIFNRKSENLVHAHFSELGQYLPHSSSGLAPLFVVNNSKVTPARILGFSPFGGKREMLLLHPPVLIMEEAKQEEDNIFSAEISVLLKPSKNTKPGETWYFAPDLWCQILEKQDFGQHKVRLYWRSDLIQVLERTGILPLPPYIKREQSQAEDKERYQTIYAHPEKAGSAAAPTAGLHFTPELKEVLLAKGCLWSEVTLHVGYGTFSPVRSEDIREHEIHKEYFELPEATAKAVLEAKAEGRPIIAVGTTACRVLEGAAQLWGNKDNTLLPAQGMKAWTNIFIYPGSPQTPLKIVDSLITNFHLPQSSLLMLVSAFAGRKRTLDVYAKAVQNKYRFFSYGDAMLIL